MKRLAKAVEKIRQGQPTQLRSCFGDLIGSSFFSLPQRRRGYDSETVFWAFLGQSLRAGSCRDAVQEIQAARAAAGLCALSPSTASYCTARQRRLSVRQLLDIHHAVGRQLEDTAPSERLWRNRPVMAVDATSVALADTPQNQNSYPQPTNQKPGCGFPVVQIVGLFGLGSGALLKYETTSLNCHENRVFYTLGLINQVPAGTVLVQDRAYCNYVNFAHATAHGFDLVARLHQARERRLEKVLPEGCDDHVSYWKKPLKESRPEYFEPKDWEAIPEHVPVRVVRLNLACPGFRSQEIIVATSLMNASREEIGALFLRRWEMEVSLGDLKTTLGMDDLMVRSPEMAEKTIAMFMIAHNLIRWTMLQAALRANTGLQRLSFKGTLDILEHWKSEMKNREKPSERRKHWLHMLDLIAEDKNPHRPGRSEPRIKKRRPKKYQLLTRPRHIMVVSPSRRLK
jgi:hypothetical protein